MQHICSAHKHTLIEVFCYTKYISQSWDYWFACVWAGGGGGWCAFLSLCRNSTLSWWQLWKVVCVCVCVHVGGYGSCFGVTGVCCGCMPMSQQPEASWAQPHLLWNINTPHACFHSKWAGIRAGLKKCPSYDWAFDNILLIWGLSVPVYYLRK